MHILFHNLRGYDAHFIFQAVEPKIHGNIKVIPKTGEEYISFTIGNMVFKDSYAFMQASLDSLAKALPKEDMQHTRKFIENGVTSIKNGYISANDSNNTINSNSLKRKLEPSKNVNSKRPCKFIIEECDVDKNHDEIDNYDNDDDNYDVNRNDISSEYQLNNDSVSSTFFQKHQLDERDYRKTPYIHPFLTEDENPQLSRILIY